MLAVTITIDTGLGSLLWGSLPPALRLLDHHP